MSAALIAIGVITILVWCLVYIPFICFHLLRFYNFRDDVTLSKRYPNITLITVSSLVIWIILLLLEVIRLFFNGPKILEDIYDFMNVIINFVVLLSILWRFWLSYYDIQFAISTSSREWQKFIDTSAQFDNWYFINKKKYGDYTWTKRRFLIGTTIYIILYIILSFFSFLAVLRFLMILIPWIGVFVIYCKTPSFYDEFGIQQEMKRILLLLSALNIAYFIAIIVIFIAENSDSLNTTSLYAALIAILFHFLALIIFLLAHTMTYWVLKIVDVGFDENGNPLRAPLNPWSTRHKRNHFSKASASGYENFESNNNGKSIPSDTSRETSDPNSQGGMSMTDSIPNSSMIGMSPTTTKEKQLKISLSTMFTDIKYLNELFQHLSREFSMECLLAMIEFIELQQYILLHMQQYKNYYFKQFPNLKIKNNVSLPKGVPRSTIIYGDNEKEVEQYLFNESGRIISIMEREQVRVRLISYQLYEKYVAIASEWEINISYETRGRLTAKLHNFSSWMSAKKKSIQMWELAQLFEDSKHEMYRLLRHSFARFKRHDDFEKIKSYHQKEMERKLQEAQAENNKGKPPKNPEAYHPLPDGTKNDELAERINKQSDNIGGNNGVVEEELYDAGDIIADLRKKPDDE